MKKASKLLVLLLALAMVFSFAACGSSDEGSDKAADEGINLAILYEQDDSMINNYSLIAVNPDAPFADADGNPVSDVVINTVGAEALINWMLSEEGKDLISEYGYEEYNEYLFYLIEDGPSSDAEIPRATEETKTIRMSTTIRCWAN